jgi:hypothetical protein
MLERVPTSSLKSGGQVPSEQFENDNSTTSNLLKALKRTMASEFSRELSVKLSTGMRRLASMGYWQGGYAPFGMARLLVGPNGEPKQILNDGEWHGVSTDRTVLVPGDPDEVETVSLAFDLYTKAHKSRRQIVDVLNQRSILPRSGKPWTMARLRRLLSADVYKGAYAYGKYVQRRLVARDRWSIRHRSFRGIVSEKQWEEANARIREEVKPYVESEMLDALRQLWQRRGRLSEEIINTAKNVPSSVAYQKHFGSLNEAYKLIGYPIPREYSFVRAITIMRRMREALRRSLQPNACNWGNGGTMLWSGDNPRQWGYYRPDNICNRPFSRNTRHGMGFIPEEATPHGYFGCCTIVPPESIDSGVLCTSGVRRISRADLCSEGTQRALL